MLKVCMGVTIATLLLRSVKKKKKLFMIERTQDWGQSPDWTSMLVSSSGLGQVLITHLA